MEKEETPNNRNDIINEEKKEKEDNLLKEEEKPVKNKGNKFDKIEKNQVQEKVENMIDNPPMAADVQKETFDFTLAEALGKDCSLDVVTSLQAKLSAKAEAIHEESPSEIAEVYIEDIEVTLKKAE